MPIPRIHGSLDGSWRLVLDPDDLGKKQQWFKGSGLPEAISVQVPSIWDLWVPDYDGVGWYLREFDLDEQWQGRRIELRFEAADYYAEVWLNGTRLGDHEGGYTPFAFDATSAARIGTNLVAVRLVDPHGPEGFGDFKPRQIPSAKEHGYFSFAGLWGSVSVVGTSRDYIADVFAQPDIRRKRVAVDVTVAGEGTVHLRIAGTEHAASGEAGRLVVEFPEHELWSPDHPKLYTLECELRKGDEVLDRVDVRFGMREFTIKDNRFHLNNHPVFIKGVLLQPDYPRTLAAPDDVELARRELELAKQAGFNLVRMHIKTPPKISLDLADEIGLLVYEEPPIGWIQKSPWMQQRCEREVREMILRDRNHASVVIWGMLNESGNAGYVVKGGAQLIKEDLCRLARSLDPSRVVIDDSGGVNATKEPARFMRPYHDDLEPYDDLHIYQRAPVDLEIESYYRHSGDPQALAFLSEFGFGGMEDLASVLQEYGEGRETLKDAKFLSAMLDAARQGFEERGLDRIFGSFEQFAAATRELQCDAARYQIDALRSNPKFGGYCYTQLSDAGHEFCAGMLDRWRRPKPVFQTLKEVQKPVRPIIQIPRINLAPREEVPVTVLLANDERFEGRVDLSLQVVGPTNQVLWKKKRSINVSRSSREIWSGNVSASGAPGTHKFVVRLQQGFKVVAESTVEFQVFERPEPADVDIHVVDHGAHWAEKCLAFARRGTATAPVHVIPPLANTIRAYPEKELTAVLSEVKGGAVALFFSPPDDWNDLAEMIDPAITATAKDSVGAFLGIYHYAKLHPVFDGLPTRGLMRQAYRNTVPPKTFKETSDEDICGAYDTSPIAAGHYMMGETEWWGSDILVRRYGLGRLVFTHLRALEFLGRDPVADRLFVNMIKNFSRRSLPSPEPPPGDLKAGEWLRRERTDNVRHWKILGMFPNWGNQGHAHAFPPEKEINLDGVYPGWYKAISWKSWFARLQDDYLVDLQAALSPVYEYYPRFDWGTAYAYAEFTTERRQNIHIRLGVQDSAKLWLNGNLIHESEAFPPLDTLDKHTIDGFVRQGRNTLLVKVSKIPGQFRFSLHLESAEREPLQVKWWR